MVLNTSPLRWETAACLWAAENENRGSWSRRRGENMGTAALSVGRGWNRCKEEEHPLFLLSGGTCCSFPKRQGVD